MIWYDNHGQWEGRREEAACPHHQRAATSNVKKLHTIRLSDSSVVNILEGTGFSPQSSESRAIVIRGPSTGYFTGIPVFLGSVIQSHSHLSSNPATSNITIHSEHDDMNPVLIPSDDLQHLQDSVVFCHNDLEPRNILVRPKELANGTTSYFIAAIIDREMSGFFPSPTNIFTKTQILAALICILRGMHCSKNMERL